MSKFWKISLVTLAIMFFVTLGIVFINIHYFNEHTERLNATIEQQDATIKKYTSQNDSLKNKLNEYGWETDLIFMCIGFESDTSESPTIKIYNQGGREIGKFLYVCNKKDKKIHLGDKFLLIAKQ